MSAFIDALRSGQIIFMDGAMGTELRRAGIADGECYEAFNLTRPEVVRDIHRAYVGAGATVLLTNTFQAIPAALSRNFREDNPNAWPGLRYSETPVCVPPGLRSTSAPATAGFVLALLTDIIAAGVILARSSLAGHGWVLADVGPFPNPEPLAITSILDACAGADGLLLETFSDPSEAELFVRVNASLPNPKPALLSFTFDGATMRTFRNFLPEDCALAAVAIGVAALGVNCGREMTIEKCAEVLTRYRTVTSLPLFARVNAGTPREGAYPHSPEEMAARLPLLLIAGATMVGGCCGTTPRHIGEFWEALKRYKRDACTTT